MNSNIKISYPGSEKVYMRLSWQLMRLTWQSNIQERWCATTR